MATLENVQGGSLVPDVSGGLNILRESFRGRAERERATAKETARKAEIDKLIGPSTGIEASILRLGAINPQLGTLARGVLNDATSQEAVEFKRRSQKSLQTAVFLGGIKDPAKRMAAIREEVQREQSADEPDQDAINALVDLARKSPELQDIAIERQRIFSTDATAIGAQRLKQLGTPTETFTTLTNEKGEVIGQQSTTTGKVISDPRTPKIPTKTSLIKNLEAINIDPNSVEGREIIKKALTKPSVKIDLSEGLDFKVPLGFMLLDKNDPSKGVTPIPGGPKDNLSTENAAKAQMLKTAQTAMPGIRELIFEENGTLDNINLFNAQFNIPNTEGRKLRNKMEFGIQAITRGETGAAMPDSEVENTRTRFMPQLGDNVEIATLKLQMFEDFINGTLKLIDPSGRFDAERFDTELQNRTQGGTERNIVVDF